MDKPSDKAGQSEKSEKSNATRKRDPVDDSPRKDKTPLGGRGKDAGQSPGAGKSDPVGGEVSGKRPGQKSFFDWKLFVASGVGILIVILFLSTSLNRSTIIKNNLVASLQDTLPVRASIQAVKAQPENANLSVGGLAIASPPGFDSPVAIIVRTLYADIADFSDGRLIIDRVSIQDTVINLSISSDRTNLTEIHENIDEFASLETARARSEEAETTVLPIEVRVRTIDFGGATMNVIVDGRALEPLAIPADEFTGPGGDDFPVTVSQAISEVFSYIAREAVRVADEAGALDSLDDTSRRAVRMQLGLDLKSQARERLNEWGDGVRTFLETNTPEALKRRQTDQ